MELNRFPLAHTFSIVARDPVTGSLGVAVQSHWFSTGSLVTWAEAGVGVDCHTIDGGGQLWSAWS